MGRARDQQPSADADIPASAAAQAAAEPSPEGPDEVDTPDVANLDEEVIEAEEESEVQRALRERDEYLDHLRRARADYENMVKRKNREVIEASDRGVSHLVGQMLGVLDNLAFALEAARDSQDDGLAKGVQMVHGELMSLLTTAGLEEVPGQGAPFDPNFHEALMQVDSEAPVDVPVVAEVYRTGYRFKGRVLRPASVQVAR